MDILTALNDPQLDERERAYIALYIFLKGNVPTDADAVTEAWARLMEFIAAGTEDESTSSASAPVLVDWESDFNLIIPAVNRIMGTECRALPFLHWYSFVAAYMEIGECLFSTVLGIRDKKARGKKLEKHEQEFVRRNPQYFRRRQTALEADLTESIRRGDYG